MGVTLNLVALEILAVNLFTTHQCSRKRYSTVIILMLYAVFTGLIMALLQWGMKPLLPTPLEGEGLYLFVGLLYFLPISIAYEQPFKRTALIMFTVWIYTTMIHAISGRIASLVPSSTEGSLLLIQSALLILTYGLFYIFIRRRFLYVLFHADGDTTSTSLLLSVLWFMVVWLLNLDFKHSSLMIDVSIMGLLIVSILLTYLVFHTLTMAEESKKAIASLTLHDDLTGLRNREALRQDILALMKKPDPFTVIFMDLDRFKEINDEHGHGEGDAYLKRFARAMESKFKGAGSLYRMSGDEFVLIHTTPDSAGICRQIGAFRFDSDHPVAFLGVSVGCSVYPFDAVDVSGLLHIADTNMYQVKKHRHATQGALNDSKDDSHET